MPWVCFLFFLGKLKFIGNSCESYIHCGFCSKLYQFCFPVPSVAPSNFKLNSKRSLTLEVTWNAIPEKQQRGELLGYRINYTNERSGVENIIDVGPDKSVYTITGLEFASYAVKLAGYTGAGVGIFTDILKRFPLEGGKKKLQRPVSDGHSEFSKNGVEELGLRPSDPRLDAEMPQLFKKEIALLHHSTFLFSAPSPPRNIQLLVKTSRSIQVSWEEPQKKKWKHHYIYRFLWQRKP